MTVKGNRDVSIDEEGRSSGAELVRPAYGWRGRVGVLVPPANTTVEPELYAGMPSGVGVYASRLPGRTQEDTSIGLRERFVGYNATLGQSADSFGGMSLDALVYACTGASYLVGPRGEPALVAELERGAAQACTAALAVRQVLVTADWTRVALVSPYPAWLTRAAVEYWQASDVEVGAVVSVPDVRSIYAVPPIAVVAAADTIPTAGIDAVILSGTGVPTLDVIPIIASRLGLPVVSSASASIWWFANTLRISPRDVACASVGSIYTWIGAHGGGAR